MRVINRARYLKENAQSNRLLGNDRWQFLGRPCFGDRPIWINLGNGYKKVEIYGTERGQSVGLGCPRLGNPDVARLAK